MLNSSFYRQLIISFALTFGAVIGIADALANAVITSDADVPGQLAAEQPTPPSIVSAPLSVGPASEPVSAVGSAPGSEAVSSPASEAVSAPASEPSSAVVSAPASSPELVSAAVNAVEATRIAVASRNLPAWLLAFSAMLWTVVAFLRRFGRLGSRKAVAAFTLVAAVIGGLASQLVLGVNVTEAIVIAFGGPGAVALNEFLRAFGFFASSNPGSGDIPSADA